MEEVEPPWQDDGLRELFGVVFSTNRALDRLLGRVAGREPTAEDMEPMSWAIFSMIRKLTRSRRRRGVRAAAVRRRLVSSSPPMTPC